ncbi:MAG: metal-sensitive transcriptional regulator [Patescibacteria group bacterium]|jgi:DNA-binding FrmR family transcriptional regulator
MLHRVRIIKGHVNAIEKMIEEDRYCIDIAHQSLAVQKALKKLDALIMKDHIRHCVVEQAKEGNTDKIAKELLEIFDYK